VASYPGLDFDLTGDYILATVASFSVLPRREMNLTTSDTIMSSTIFIVA
jgi:hypothetical protein